MKWFCIISFVKLNQNADIEFNTLPLNGIPCDMITSKADNRSVETNRRSSTALYISLTLPEAIFVSLGNSGFSIISGIHYLLKNMDNKFRKLQKIFTSHFQILNFLSNFILRHILINLIIKRSHDDNIDTTKSCGFFYSRRLFR